MSDQKDRSDLHEDTSSEGRRGFLHAASKWMMAGGLVTGYGTCAGMGARYLFPSSKPASAWLFVARTSEIAAGEALSFRAPSGQRIALARQGSSGGVEDFVALSSTCPHLGCQVHWEEANKRFFCPCHNGAFDATGVATEGPPAEAGQSLPRFPLAVREGSLFIEVPTGSLASAPAERDPRSELALRREHGSTPPGPGHDPCLHDASDPRFGLGPGRHRGDLA